MSSIIETPPAVRQEKNTNHEAETEHYSLEDLGELLQIRDSAPEGELIRLRTIPPERRNRGPEYDLDRPYQLALDGQVDDDLLQDVFARHRMFTDQEALVLPFGERNTVGLETRQLYFHLVTGPDGKLSRGSAIQDVEEHYQALPVNRIVSFGDCNVACPYCKRDCQFIDESGHPLVSLPIQVRDIARLAEGAVAQGETVRFSGGDPVMYPKPTLALAEYLYQRHKSKVSIAHNGSGPRWVEQLLPYLSSAAIDLKAVAEQQGRVMGVSAEKGERLHQLSLETQRLVSHNNGTLLDVRTPVFGETSDSEMLRLAEEICTNDDLDYTFWTWRMYKPVEGCDWAVPSRENTIEMMQRVSSRFPDLWMGMRAKWEKGGMLYVKNGRIVTGTPDLEQSDVLEMGSGNRISARESVEI